MNANANLYEQDFYAWTMKNAQLLRQGKMTEIDVEHVAEELESMVRSERPELINRLAVLLAYLLKWQLQPPLRGKKLDGDDQGATAGGDEVLEGKS